MDITNQKELLNHLRTTEEGFFIADRVTLSDVLILMKELEKLFLSSINQTADELGIPVSNQTFLTDFFPADFFPATKIFVENIEFAPKSSDSPMHLLFTLGWEGFGLTIIPDYFSIVNIRIVIEIIGSRVFATLNGFLKLKEYELKASVKLPSTEAKISLLNRDPNAIHPPPLTLLQEFQALPHPTDNADLTLNDLLIVGNAHAQRFVFALGLGGVKIGQALLDGHTEITYTKGAIGTAFWADFTIEIAEKTTVFLPLYAAHPGPSEGWQLEGGLALQGINFIELFKALLAKIAPNSTNKIHDALAEKDAEVRSVFVAYNTATKAFDFACSLDFHGFFGVEKHANAAEEDEVELNIKIGGRPDGSGNTQLNFSGQLIFHIQDIALEFDFVFGKDAHHKTLIAVYKDLAGKEVNIMKIIHQLNDQLPNSFNFEVALEEACFIFSKEKETTAYLFGAKIKAEADLSALPLIGQTLSSVHRLGASIQPFYASKPFTEEQLNELQNQLPSGSLALPNKPVSGGVDLDVVLYLGTEPLHLGLDLTASDVNPNSSGAAADTESTSSGSSASVSGAEASAQDGTKWIEVKKSFSIFHLNRIGLLYQKPKFLLQLDGSLTAAGLTLSLDGFGIGLALPELAPSFSIHGLGLDYKKGALEIGGAFLRTTVTNDEGTFDEYDGMAVIKSEKFSLSALGSYARLNGETSLFIYALLKANLGGPAFFFVTGLAAGFGYNRKVTKPKASGVLKFPLIQQAISEDLPPSEANKRSGYLSDTLSKLNAALPIEHGEYFLAIGVQFNSFKLIDSFALLTVNFGVDLEFDLLGISTLVVPKKLPGEDTTPLAIVQLAIAATYLPEKGFLEVAGSLTNVSHILSKDCHLRGDFLFRTWFKGEHRGDFVLSIGGFHKHFKVPAHYGVPPKRLGFDWQVSSALSLTGNLYGALTAHAVMAGGSFKASYSDTIEAHFILSADLLISWKPYHYEFGISVEIGVHIPIFGGFDLSAEVSVWGPEFSGHAEIDICVGTYTVDFGNDKPTLKAIDWNQFRAAFIPDINKVCSMSVTEGLLQTMMIKSNSSSLPSIPHHLINPKQLEIEVTSLVPITQITGASLVLEKNKTIAPIGAAPMAISKGGITSQLDITFTGPATDRFSLKGHFKKVPSAIWGGSLKPSINSELFIDALSGFTIVPNSEPTPGRTKEIDRSELKFETITKSKAFHFAPFKAVVKDPTVSIFQLPLNDIQIALKELGFEETELQKEIKKGLMDVFISTPSLVTL